VVTLRAVFPTVDVYPDWADSKFAQAIAIAESSPRPTTDALIQRALALQHNVSHQIHSPAAPPIRGGS
jgi:hypothetical protein